MRQNVVNNYYFLTFIQRQRPDFFNSQSQRLGDVNAHKRRCIRLFLELNRIDIFSDGSTPQGQSII